MSKFDPLAALQAVPTSEGKPCFWCADPWRELVETMLTQGEKPTIQRIWNAIRTHPDFPDRERGSSSPNLARHFREHRPEIWNAHRIR